MKKNMTKIIGLILVISIIALSCVTLSGCSQINSSVATANSATAVDEVGEISATALVKTVTEYNKNFETQEWEKAGVTEYTYENGYPVAVTTTETDGAQSKKEYEYTFDGDLPATRIYADENYTYTVEYNNGRTYQMSAKSDDGLSSQAEYYQYANDDEYFTFLLHEEHMGVPEGEGETGSGDKEETDSITVVSEDGLLVKTINTGMYANWLTGEKKEWQRFNGTYTVEYDADGIAKLTSGVFRAGPSGIQSKFDVTKENGRVTEAIVLTPNSENDGYDEFTRFTFEYTDTEISDSRYATMINSFLLGEANSYYRYLWY